MRAWVEACHVAEEKVQLRRLLMLMLMLILTLTLILAWVFFLETMDLLAVMHLYKLLAITQK